MIAVRATPPLPGQQERAAMKKMSVVAALAALLLVTPAIATPAYTFTDLGTLGTYSAAYGINDLGQVVGSSGKSDGSGAAYLWHSSVMTELPGLDGGATWAWKINNSGQIVGSSARLMPFPGTGVISGYRQPVTWTSGALTQLPTFDIGILDPVRGDAMAINSSGQLVGNVFNTSALWSGGSIANIGIADSNSFATSINDTGQVVGYYFGTDYSGGFVWQQGVVTRLDGYAFDINNAGVVVGQTSAGRPYSWNGDAYTIMSLGPAATRGTPTAINDSGSTVGYIYVDQTVAGALWQDGELFQLDSLVAESNGWHLEYGSDINASGQIVGYATKPTGEMHAFLLDPIAGVPEPSSTLLLLTGLTGLLGLGTRRRADPHLPPEPRSLGA
jgi:probable HAF family extracellular repeat protein